MPKENETTTKFKVDISELKKAMQDAKRAVAVANSEFKKTAATMDDWTKSTAGISAKLKQLDSNLKNQEKILDSLEKQYELTVKEMGEGSKAADNLRIKINNQKAVISKTEREISEYEKALDEVSKAEIKAAKEGKTVAEVLEETGNEAENAEGGFTVLKGAVAGFISGALMELVKGLGSAITALGSFGDAADKALDGFQAATGASAAEMADFDKVMTNIYNKNLGDSFDDIANSMATVKQMAGDIGAEELEKLTSNALVLRDTFGMEVNESMRAAQSLMDQFGVSGDEAFNLIAQGAQNGLNQNQDLTDVINEYSVQFKDAGYSAEEMFNMLKNGADSGTWSVDKLGDAVKEYNIRMTDGTANEYLEMLGLNADAVTAKYAKGGEAAQEANNQVISALMGVEDEQQRYIIGQGIMGTMWEDLGEDAIKSLMSTEGEISKTKNALEKIGNVKYSSLGEALQGIGRNLQTGILLPIADKILPKLQELADKFSEWLNDPGTQAAIDNLATNIGEVLVTAINAAKTAFQWIIDNKDLLIGAFSAIAGGFAAFKAVSIVTSVIGTITKLIGIVKGLGSAMAVVKAVMAAMGGPVTIVITIIGALVTAFITLWNTSDEFRNFWINLWEKIKEACSVAADWIKQQVDKIGAFFTETLPEFFNSCIEWIKANWQSILLFLINPFAGLFKYFYDNNTKFKEFVDNAVNFIKELPGKIWEWLTNTINKIGEWITSMKEKATEAGKNFVDNLITFFKELPGKIGDFLYNTLVTITGSLIAMGILAYKHGKEFVENLINFFKQLPGKIHTWLTNTISKVTAWASKMKTKAKETAKNFIDTVVNFIKELPGKIWTWLQNTISKVTTWASKMKAKAKETASNFINTVVNFIKQLPGKVYTWLQNTISKVTTWASNMKAKAKETAQDFINNVVNKIKELPNKVWTWLQNVVTKVTSWGTNLKNKGKEAATKLYNAVVEKVQELPDKMASIGSDIVAGIWNGINDMAGWIKEKISGFVGDVESWLKEFFGINSPSRLMADEVGAYLPAGIAEGIEENASDINGSLKTLGRYIVQGIMDYIKEMPEEMESCLKSVTAKVTEWGEELIIKGQYYAKKFIEFIKSEFAKEKSKLFMVGYNCVFAIEQGLLARKEALLETAKEIAGILGEVMNASEAINNVRSAAGGITFSTQGASSGKTGAVTVNNFNQTINSPKQLSRIEIYRQSKNLLNYNSVK